LTTSSNLVGCWTGRSIVKGETAIPLVMIGDPVGAKLATSWDRPGGTVTGLASNSAQIIAHRVKLLKTVVPEVTRAGFIAKGDSPATPAILQMTRTAAGASGIELIPVDVRLASDMESAFETMIKRGAQGFIFYPVPMPDTRIAQLAEKAIQHTACLVGRDPAERHIGSAPWVRSGLSRAGPPGSALRPEDIGRRSARRSADWCTRQVRIHRQSPNG